MTIANTMTLLTVLPQILHAVSTISQSVGNAHVPRYLDIASALVSQGVEAWGELIALRDLVQAMAEEGRDPTDAEWEALQVQSDVAHRVIQSYNLVE